MAVTLPYMTSHGLIPKILEKVQNARRPERFTQDFLETKLGHSGGSARAIIPFLKRMGFLASDGVPTDLYNKFRNIETKGAAIAHGMKNCYKELFDKNEYVYEMSRDKLLSHVIEITGGKKDDSRTKAIVGTFMALKDLADFETELSESSEQNTLLDQNKLTDTPPNDRGTPQPRGLEQVGFSVSYTISLNLPETTDPNVFNAIFKALKENLLTR